MSIHLRCVACGEELEDDNHHCDPLREQSIEARRNQHWEDHHRGLSEAQRLNRGLEIMFGEENE